MGVVVEVSLLRNPPNHSGIPLSLTKHPPPTKPLLLQRHLPPRPQIVHLRRGFLTHPRRRMYIPPPPSTSRQGRASVWRTPAATQTPIDLLLSAHHLRLPIPSSPGRASHMPKLPPDHPLFTIIYIGFFFRFECYMFLIYFYFFCDQMIFF